MRIVVYTDGACSRNGHKSSRASWATWFPAHPEWSDAQPVEGDVQTNNRGELGAILAAFRRVKKEMGTGIHDVDMLIYTDSEYSKNCLTKWVGGWIRKNWMTASGTPVLNRDLIEAVLLLQPQFHSVTYEYVRAHTGGSDEHSKHNDRVDRMARGVLDPSVIPAEAPPPTENVLGDCPLQQMGPPVSTATLAAWAKANLDKLDSKALEKALIKVLAETFKNEGLTMEVRKGNATLTSGLQVASVVVSKTE